MDAVPQDFNWVWQEVIEQLVAASDDPMRPDLTLRASDRSLLASVRPVGQVNGYVLLTATSTQAKKLIEGQLSHHITAALFQVTGKNLHVVLTVAESAPDNDDQYTNPGAGQQGGFRFDGLDSSQRAQSAQHPQNQQNPGSEQVHGYDNQRSQVPQSTQHPQNHQNHGYGSGAGQRVSDDQGRRDSSGHYGDHQAQLRDSQTRDYGYRNDQVSGYNASSATTSRPVSHSHSQGAPNHSVQGPVGATQQSSRPKVPHQMSDPVEEPTLNRKYTFETFVQGPQNKIAAAAAVAVAESPGRSYNPLYIAGPSGLGKTHLLHAIGHYALNLHPQLKLKYVSSEEFTNDFITSLREDAQESFKRRYRNLDMLLVDDIQFLAGKEGTQEEFFHTFNALYQTNRQIVLSSDRPPSQLVTLEDRLRTRFEQGLFADLSLPDLETRIAILQKKVEQVESMSIPEDVLVFIAENNNTSIRALEGDLLQISAQASLLKRAPTVELAREVLGTQVEPVEITAELIIGTTAEYFGLSVKDLESDSRSRPVSHARQISMHLIRRMTNLSLVSIGAALGDRDHSTIKHGDDKIEKEQAVKETTRREIKELTARIQEQARL